MSAEVIEVQQMCRKCGARLTLEEIHYYHQGNEEATCNNCEAEWSAEMDKWRSEGGDGQTPVRP